MLLQPLPLFVILRYIDALDFEDDRPRPIVAAGDHHAVVIRPALHDGAALQSRVHISADGIPGFTAELAVHQVIKIILLGCALEQKSIAHVEERAGAGFGISQVLLLIVSEALKYL